jgi:multidrug efflux pump subunit AcrB
LRPAVPQQRPANPQAPQAQRPPIRPNAVTVTRGSGTTQADFEIHLDREAMAANKVEQATVAQSLQQFFTTYPFFSLIDLQDLKIKSTDGKEVQLKQIATVDVWFGPAKTEIVVGSGK